MSRHLKNPVLLIFWAIGLFLGLGGLWLVARQHQVSNWPLIDVKVLRSEVVATSNDQLTGEIEVEKRQNRAVVLHTSFSSRDRSSIEDSIAFAKVGSDIEVHQNPADSADLRIPAQGSDKFLGLALVAGGLLFALVPVGVLALTERNDALVVGGKIFVAIGVTGIMFAFCLAYQKATIIKTWPEVEATIVSSRVLESAGRRRLLYGIEATVRFEAGADEVETRVRSSWRSSDKGDIERALSGSFAPDQKLLIKHSILDTSLATFEAGWTFRYFQEIILALALSLMMSLLGLAIAKMSKS